MSEIYFQVFQLVLLIILDRKLIEFIDSKRCATQSGEEISDLIYIRNSNIDEEIQLI